MSLQVSLDLVFTLISVLTLISGFVSAVLAVIAWRHRSIPIIQPFLLLMAAVTLWIFGYAAELISSSLPAVILINDIEYIGILTVPVAWLFLVLMYTGRGHYLTRRTVPLFFVIPAIIWILVLTNPLHSLFYSGFGEQYLDGDPIWIFNHGSLFWIHIAYSYLLTLIALVLAAGRLFGSTKLYRRQSAILVGAACIPAFSNMVYVFRLSPFPEYDLTPVSFLLTGIILAIGILRYQLFSSVPVAYSRVFSAMGDGVVVADRKNRVLDLNPIAEQIAGMDSSRSIGQDIAGVIPELAPVTLETFSKSARCHFEIRCDSTGTPRYFDVLVTPMKEGIISDGVYLCLLRDISGRKQVELALAEAYRKMGLLANITRHDITNKIVAVHSYLELIREIATDPIQIEYLGMQEQALEAMNEQIAFTKEYQQLGTGTPAWQDLGTAIRIAKTHVDLGKVVLESTPGSWEILADPMLEKVFYNLCDNAVKYGGPDLAAIRISSHVDENDLVVVVQDDGAGIPAKDKPHLFERGFGKHTGLGLFLSKEILAITDITIRETGEPGRGARFEIRVPAGKFRGTSDTGS
jgi:PAS domain S-box-containing protein